MQFLSQSSFLKPASIEPVANNTGSIEAGLMAGFKKNLCNRLSLGDGMVCLSSRMRTESKDSSFNSVVLNPASQFLRGNRDGDSTGPKGTLALRHCSWSRGSVCVNCVSLLMKSEESALSTEFAWRSLLGQSFIMNPKTKPSDR